MKRILLLLFFIFNLVLLPGLQLNKFYHKNYGIADRTVFVFDYEPSYFLEETEDSIILLISRSSLSSDIIDLPLENNPVLSSYAFSSREDDLKIVIQINRDISETRKFGVEEFLLRENKEYKLVLDIFKYETPLNRDELNSYINFYNLVELKGKAVELSKKLDEFPIEDKLDTDKTEDEITETPEVASTQKKKESGENIFTRLKNFFQFYIPGLNLLIAAILVIAVLILIIVTITLKKKARVKDVFHDKERLGSKSFSLRVIKILKEAGWEDSMIAEELGISLDEVKNGSR
ncbi:hypothetical protein ACFLYK_02460 [Candidatus Cloacimonadota bacterium]